MKVSVIVPARDEEWSIGVTITLITEALSEAGIPYEIVVVNDGSTDGTSGAVLGLAAGDPQIQLVHNTGRNGFGLAVRAGIPHCTGDAIAVMMADNSDSPADLVRYVRLIEQGYDCAFGSRFGAGGKVIDYPRHKLVLNRFANWFIQVLFGIRFNDITNAFKCYRREVIDGMQPLISPHFNLTVEMPLKAIVRGYSYAVTPITWTNRKHGVSKLKIKEMGSRYLFIVMYLWLEKHLSRGDYRRARQASAAASAKARSGSGRA